MGVPLLELHTSRPSPTRSRCVIPCGMPPIVLTPVIPIQRCSVLDPTESCSALCQKCALWSARWTRRCRQIPSSAGARPAVSSTRRPTSSSSARRRRWSACCPCYDRIRTFLRNERDIWLQLCVIKFCATQFEHPRVWIKVTPLKDRQCLQSVPSECSVQYIQKQNVNLRENMFYTSNRVVCILRLIIHIQRPEVLIVP